MSGHETLTLPAPPAPEDLLETISDGFMAYDRDWRYTYLNTAAERISGKRRDDLLGKNVWDHNPEAAGTVFEQNFRRAVAEQIPIEFEAFYPPRDRWYSMRLFPSARGLSVFFQDVSARKKSEEELRQSEERFRTLVASSAVIIWSTNGKGEAVTDAPGWQEFTGQSAEQMKGHGWVNAVHPDDQERSRLAWRAAIEQKAPFDVECRMRRHDGVYRDILDRGVPILDGDGNIREWVGTCTDVTEHKQAESEMRRARDAADAANRAKDEFLAILSHELRTPISAILIWANLLQSGSLNEHDRREALDTIVQSAKEQSQLVNDLLDASRILYGKMRTQMLAVNLCDVVRAAANAIRPDIQAKGIELRLELADAIVRGDASLLRRVAANLLSNALKFTPAGGIITVTIELDRGDAFLEVSDTGEGISPEFLPHLFDHFRQADSSSTRKHGGLGLGLSIVRQLVDLHNGSVRAESEGVGQGARLIVTLPSAVGAAAEGPPALLAKSTESLPDLDGVGVLVVDDDLNTRESLAAILKSCGAQTRTAHCVPEAMKILGHWNPHVLVSDIAMPGHDGYELIQRVRQLAAARGEAIPSIALTAYASADDRSKALSAGFDAYLAKPIGPVEFVQAVASAVRGTVVARAPSPCY
jgi:PAS domain S-box-containing protein